MVDREKVVALLMKRFGRAPLCDIAAAANAIVGLDPEYEPIGPGLVRAFVCDTDEAQFGARDVAAGEIVLYRRVRSPASGCADS